MTNIKNMPSEARVWVYQSNRLLSEAEVKEIEVLGGATVMELEVTTCWGTRSCPLPVSITHDVRLTETSAPRGTASFGLLTFATSTSTGAEPR